MKLDWPGALVLLQSSKFLGTGITSMCHHGQLLMMTWMANSAESLSQNALGIFLTKHAESHSQYEFGDGKKNGVHLFHGRLRGVEERCVL